MEQYEYRAVVWYGEEHSISKCYELLSSHGSEGFRVIKARACGKHFVWTLERKLQPREPYR